MSAPVDVLAVWDEAVELLRDRAPAMRSRMSEARAAVAELVEAMTAERLARDTSAPVSQLVAAIERTDAALARVGGAS